jgi:hypothetical protein
MPTEKQYREAAKLPIIGKWIARLGRTANILATPCAAEPMIWVEAAWINLPHLLFGFIKPFKLAMDYNIHTGRGSRWGLPHGGPRKGKRGRAPYGAIVEGLIEDAGKIFGPEASWAMFALGDLALKAEWYFFLADLSTEFLVNWVSTAYMWGGCPVPGFPTAHAHAIGGFTYIPTTNGAIFDGWAWDQQNTGMRGGPTGIVIALGPEASVGYNIETGPWPQFPLMKQATWSSQLIDSHGNLGPIVEAKLNGKGGRTATYMSKGYAAEVPTTEYSVLLHINADGVWYCTSGTMQATSSKGDGNLHPDP